MKSKWALLAVLLAVFLTFGTAHSSLIDGSGLGILLIDGENDKPTNDFTVSPFVQTYGGYDLYYATDGVNWIHALAGGTSGVIGTFAGGTVLDFALDVNKDSQISGIEDNYSFNTWDAVIKYANLIDSTNAEQPSRTSDYYRNVTIFWLNLPIGDVKIEFLGAQEYDGFAPVPIPSALLLLGSGLIGLVSWRRWKGQRA